MRALAVVIALAGCLEQGPPVCGDGVFEFPERCDDGNTVSGDGCSSDCMGEHYCGNGTLDPGEECESGPICDPATCSFVTVFANVSWQFVEVGGTSSSCLPGSEYVTISYVQRDGSHDVVGGGGAVSSSCSSGTDSVPLRPAQYDVTVGSFAQGLQYQSLPQRISLFAGSQAADFVIYTNAGILEVTWTILQAMSATTCAAVGATQVRLDIDGVVSAASTFMCSAGSAQLPVTVGMHTITALLTDDLGTVLDMRPAVNVDVPMINKVVALPSFTFVVP